MNTIHSFSMRTEYCRLASDRMPSPSVAGCTHTSTGTSTSASASASASASTSVEIVKRIKTRHDDVQIEPKTVRCLVNKSSGAMRAVRDRSIRTAAQYLKKQAAVRDRSIWPLAW